MKEIKIVETPNLGILKLIHEIQEAVLEGYRFNEDDDLYILTNPSVISIQLSMVKENKTNTEVKSFNVEELTLLIEKAVKYKELKEIAEKYNLTIPDKIFNPKALKKVLLSQLSLDCET